MSRRGNCYDNATAENFFSILKTECIYRHHATTFEEARLLIDNYIYFYNHHRIQLKTGAAPLTLRHSAVLEEFFPPTFITPTAVLDWQTAFMCPLGSFTES